MLARNILLAIGILALAAGIMLAVVWLRQPQTTGTQATAPVLPTREALVAARPIPAGTLLRLEDMAWGEVPAAEVLATNILRGTASETDFVGSVTRRAFREREPLAASALVKPGDRDFLVAALAPGSRAISIAVDAAQSESGLMLPGDRVDVVLTQTFNTPGTADPRLRSVSETVLHDLRIIAVDQTLNPNAKPAEPRLGAGAADFRLPKTITLEVTEQQAEMLLVADQLGKVQLTLRGQQAAEADATATEPVPPTWAYDVSPALGNLAPGAPKATDKGHGTIEVMHGPKLERRCPSGVGLVTCP
jgi:pilus assembly protein CpaB